MDKIVMIVNKALPTGLAANTAAVLGISLGTQRKDIVGAACMDKSGVCHKGITEQNIPVLAAPPDDLNHIYRKSIDNDQISVIDFSKTAQASRNYTEYASTLSTIENNDLEFSGLCLSGPEKEIISLTGSLPLFR